MVCICILFFRIVIKARFRKAVMFCPTESRLDLELGSKGTVQRKYPQGKRRSWNPWWTRRYIKHGIRIHLVMDYHRTKKQGNSRSFLLKNIKGEKHVCCQTISFGFGRGSRKACIRYRQTVKEPGTRWLVDS